LIYQQICACTHTHTHHTQYMVSLSRLVFSEFSHGSPGGRPGKVLMQYEFYK
jgi:hypothetical protein